MKHAWSLEFSRIAIAIIFALLFGFASKAWFIAILIPSAIYIGWLLMQLRDFERWLSQGAQTGLAPNTSGIIEIMVQHIYRAQKQHEQKVDRLTRLSERFEATISALPDATLVLNNHLEIQWSNQASIELLGIRTPSDLGQRLDNIIRKPELQKLLQNNKHAEEIEMHSPIDPQIMLVLRSVEFGEQQRLLIAKDISQQISLQQLRKNFISNASHELRTPLTVISGYLEMLETDSLLPKLLHTPIKNAGQQALRMQKILDDMLHLSKLEESGHSKVNRQPVDVISLITTIINDFKRSSNSHQFELELEQEISLIGVEEELHSLVQNLLSNAIKYSAKGSSIEVCWKSTPKGACLSIKDYGEGIEQAHISRLTERFYRVNVVRSRKVGGTGLGLSIVKHILDNMGAYLEIQSRAGKGSTFIAHFPKNK